MNYNKPGSMLALLLLLAAGLNAQTREMTLAGPDGLTNMKLVIASGKLSYSVSRKGQPVIESSSMGLVINGKETGDVYRFGPKTRKLINETYAWRGVHSLAHDQCLDIKIPVLSVTGATVFELETRVYNNGAAFRYLVAATGKSAVTADLTSFEIPAGSVAWSQDDISGYEGKYQQQAIEEIKAGQLAGPPLTIKFPGDEGYAAITEGGVTDFAGMSLKADGKNGFQANLTGTTNLTGNIASPWRIIETGDLNALVNSDIIADVSPRPDKTLFPQGFATPWLKPGKSAWSWLAGNGEVKLDNMERYSKWAGEAGLSYNLVDEGWSGWKDGPKDKFALLKELVDYSAKQGVKVWVWKAYPDRNGVPGLKDAAIRQAFFLQCKKAGVVGLKIDFFDTETQEVLEFYQHALRDAARLHLMLDFHGADKPTGQSRTWPNEMSREGIRGLENGSDWPVHNTTLVFTRYLAGHGDYTPLSFRDIVKGTTMTHQVATVVAFTSPFMCLAVDPEALLKSQVAKIVRDIPVVWDETRVLPQSEIGKLALLARRSGKRWYLTALNGADAKDITVSASFLGKGNYTAVLLEDKPADPSTSSIRKSSITHKESLDLSMSSGGGFLGIFTEKK